VSEAKSSPQPNVPLHVEVIHYDETSLPLMPTPLRIVDPATLRYFSGFYRETSDAIYHLEGRFVAIERSGDRVDSVLAEFQKYLREAHDRLVAEQSALLRMLIEFGMEDVFAKIEFMRLHGLLPLQEALDRKYRVEGVARVFFKRVICRVMPVTRLDASAVRNQAAAVYLWSCRWVSG
jgi:hypothetical protein